MYKRQNLYWVVTPEEEKEEEDHYVGAHKPVNTKKTLEILQLWILVVRHVMKIGHDGGEVLWDDYET